jgi:CRP-like cAMP-binding protein
MKSRIDLAGNLSFIALPDLLQLLGTYSSSGVLKILSRYTTEPGFIYLHKGNPIDARHFNRQGLDALFSLFGWVEGRFEFTSSLVQKENIIKKSRMEIVLEGLRLLDEGQIVPVGPQDLTQSIESSSKNRQIPVINGPIVDYWYVVDEEEFEGGELIVEEGKHGDWMWVVLEGSVDILRKTPAGPVTILRIGSGAFLGSIASFLTHGNVRSASVMAVGNVQLGVLDSQRLANEFSGMTPTFRSFMVSLDRRLRQITGHLMDMYDHKKPTVGFDPKWSPVIRQGETFGNLYSITEGKAFIVRESEQGSFVVAELRPGDFIGFVPFLDIGHEPYSAAVYSLSKLGLEKIDADTLEVEYSNLSSTFQNFIDYTAACVSITTTIAGEVQKKSLKTDK